MGSSLNIEIYLELLQSLKSKSWERPQLLQIFYLFLGFKLYRQYVLLSNFYFLVCRKEERKERKEGGSEGKRETLGD